MSKQHSSKSIMWAVIVVAAILIAVIFPLAVKHPGSAADNVSGGDEAESRIQPIAKFELAQAPAAATSSGPRDGATIFNTICGACHNTGAAGAPKIDDKAAWAPRLATGKAALINSVTNGKNAMPAKGGATLSEEEIKNAVDYIMSKAK